MNRPLPSFADVQLTRVEREEYLGELRCIAFIAERKAAGWMVVSYHSPLPPPKHNV